MLREEKMPEVLLPQKPRGREALQAREVLVGAR